MAIYPLELRTMGKTSPMGSATWHSRRHPRHADKRLRPLSRRRLRISRPPRVSIRARNPCARARFRFLGW